MIYVDSPKEYPWTPLRHTVWSHLWSDTCFVDAAGVVHDDELHALAEAIGLKRVWYQLNVGPDASAAATCRRSHYDVVPAKRLLALRRGAVAMELHAYLARLTETAVSE